ncbi:SIMPL domain-containing protein [Halobacillus salinus]|uniref:SIMPL domain-containing protein n=1 Tax=Halobacillus salinus TaxID=192814 RepID=UPI0015915EA6|nr:SIMPL domain-containing protein [Halobacillus salinus]
MHENQTSIPVLWVSGMGRVKVEPDMTEVKVGVVTENQSLSVAQSQSAEVVTKLIQSLQEAGIKKQDIQTDEYYIFPEYDYQDGNQEFRGYRVTHILNVTVDNIRNVGAIIDLAVSNGANRVSNVSFHVRNRTEYEQEALRRSLYDAQRKAQTVCQTLGVHLYPVPIKIVEGSSDVREERPVTYGKTTVLSSASTPVEAGQTEITAQVQVQFTYYSPQ